MRRFIIVLALILSFRGLANDITSWIEEKDHPMSYESSYFTQNTIDDYRYSLESLMLSGTASFKGFELSRLGDYLIWHDSKDIHPTVIVNLKGQRSYIVEAPHAGFETSTAKQAVILLEKLNARVAIISGSHRCASNEFSPCSGTTGVCGVKGEAYRISDSSHSEKNLFQVAHEFFVDFYKGAKVIQLHEMMKTSSPHKIILSSTAFSYSKNPNDFVTAVRNNLRVAHRNKQIAVSCNAVDDSELKFRKLCGFTNTQGRYLNKSVNVCSELTELDSNRFIHIEQDYSTTLKDEFMKAMIYAFEVL